MTLRESSPMPPEEARLLNPLQLAYIGDTVWDLMIRSRLAFQRLNVRHMHQRAIKSVNAHAQAQALNRLEGALEETEAEIVRRGRNTHAKHPCPKNQDPADYAAATGLEALIGYLYLTGQDARLMQLFALSQQEETSCPAHK